MASFISYPSNDFASGRVQKLSQEIDGLVTLRSNVEKELKFQAQGTIYPLMHSNVNWGSINTFTTNNCAVNFKTHSSYYNERVGVNFGISNSPFLATTPSYLNSQVSANFGISNVHSAGYPNNLPTTTPSYLSNQVSPDFGVTDFHSACYIHSTPATTSAYLSSQIDINLGITDFHSACHVHIPTTSSAYLSSQVDVNLPELNAYSSGSDCDTTLSVACSIGPTNKNLALCNSNAASCFNDNLLNPAAYLTSQVNINLGSHNIYENGYCEEYTKKVSTYYSGYAKNFSSENSFEIAKYCSQLSECEFVVKIVKRYHRYLDTYFAQLISSSVKSADKRLESVNQKIKRIKKLITTLRTKILQLKKFNKKSLFRKQVNLIYKNMDDTHLNFELFIMLAKMIIQKFKYYPNERFNKTVDRFSYKIKMQ
ncbi:MAG TPA: hypothetical protein VK668_08520 [Mucilaginibacter sp.]|nr:hypothetical protein [Mucilaginibacter sp.]